MMPFFIPCPPPGAGPEVWAKYERRLAEQDRENWILLWLHIAVFGIGLAVLAAVPFIFPRGLC